MSELDSRNTEWQVNSERTCMFCKMYTKWKCKCFRVVFFFFFTDRWTQTSSNLALYVKLIMTFSSAHECRFACAHTSIHMTQMFTGVHVTGNLPQAERILQWQDILHVLYLALSHSHSSLQMCVWWMFLCCCCFGWVTFLIELVCDSLTTVLFIRFRFSKAVRCLVIFRPVLQVLLDNLCHL